MTHRRVFQHLQLHDLEPSAAEFRASVIQGFSMAHKSLPCKFFYDAEGSRLFEQICALPEYYLTRTECRILAEHDQEIATFIRPEATLVEFGSGAGIKIRLLLEALRNPSAYIPVDISRKHLVAAASDLARDFPELYIAPVCADYTKSFALPPIDGNRVDNNVGFFPGSTIGNFTPMEASAFLARTRRLLGRDAVMIVGVDLVKDKGVLEAAYNDSAGVTAAFNLNLLHRINRELKGAFDVTRFAHQAKWNASHGRIEMHLVSRCQQTVYVGNYSFDFAEGERIHTENSYKYSLEQFRRVAGEAGYMPLAAWTDDQELFSVHMLRAM